MTVRANFHRIIKFGTVKADVILKAEFIWQKTKYFVRMHRNRISVFCTM